MEEAVRSAELRAAFRFALVASSALHNGSLIVTDEPAFNPRDPRLRKLIEGVLFSRKFILTYQLVLLSFLLYFTAVHWARKWGRWRRSMKARKRVDREQHGLVDDSKTLDFRSSSSSSSSSSASAGSSNGKATHFGSSSPLKSKRIFVLESTPLLTPPTAKRPPLTTIQAVRSKVLAWGMYQPRPLPFGKMLPSNATSLAVLFLVALNVFYVFYHMTFTVQMLFVFADRTSLLFVANLPLLYILAAKNQPLEWLTGYSYESLNIFHRRLGEVVCLLAFLHSLGMVGVWYTLLRPGGFSLARFLLSKVILLGIGVLVAYETLYFTSLASFRQRWYELFLGFHVVGQLVALVLLWFHHSGSRLYVAVALAIFVVDRVFWRMSLKNMMVKGEARCAEDGETVLLRFRYPLNLSVGSFRTKNLLNGWRSTDHVFLTVPALSRKHIFQAHPFTIASAAPPAGAEIAQMEFIIRAQDGFSRDLLQYANRHKDVTARIDGPYGSQEAVEMLRRGDFCILVAGGSGIAVTWPLLNTLMETVDQDDIESSADGTSAKKKILFIWIVQKEVHSLWIDKKSIEDMRQRGVEVMTPSPTATHGRADLNFVVRSWVERHAMTRPNARVGVVCSGPDSMGRTVRNACSELVGEGWDVNISIEKFGW
jgi:NAD(P)H-flavin reductase